MRRDEKAYAPARTLISQFASNLLPSPNLASFSSYFSNVISNGGFYVLKWWSKDDPLATKAQPFKDKVKAQTAEIAWHSKSCERKQRILGERSCHDRSNHHGLTVAGTMAKPWWLLPSSVFCFSNATCWSRLGPQFLPWICRIGSIKRYLLAFLNPVGLNFIFLS